MPSRNVEQVVDFPFPLGGIDRTAAYCRQPFKDVAPDRKAPTTPSGQNVRGWEPGSDRLTGASRGGLSKYVAAAVVPNYIVQDLGLLAGVGYTPPGGGMTQFSNSGRVISVVAVSQGDLYVANAGDAAWSAVSNSTGNSPPLSISGAVFSAENNQKLYYADGVNWVVYDPTTNTASRWNPSAGVLPVDAQNNTPRLICTWRGRTVLSGLLKDPQNVFMSAVSDPTNFDYSPLSVTPTQAVAFNSSPMGYVGDVVTSLCPYTDDVLVIFGDHTIWMLAGDPMAGGQLDRVSDAIGGTWGICWAKDPYGTIYFFSNRTGIFTLVPGQSPVRISQQIEQLVRSIDTGANSIRLAWDDRYQGLHVFVSPLAAPAATTHFFWEQRSGAWWTDTFANPNHSPVACCVFDGNTPGDRVTLLGSWDGYVRSFSDASATDDGSPISSSVVLGPILSPTQDEMLLKDLQAVLGETSGSVTYSVYVGRSAEAALASSPVATGAWNAGRNLNSHVRRSGHAVYVVVTSTSQWALEQLRARFEATGKVRMRAYT